MDPGNTPSTVESAIDLTVSDEEIAIRNLVELLRARLRDYPELNVLLAGYENSDLDLATALAESVMDWNSTPPLLDGVSFSSHPAPTLMLDKATSAVLRSAALGQIRNKLNANVGGDVINGFFDKGPEYAQWAALLEQTYETKKLRLKMAINLNGSFNGTGIASEYEIVNRMYNTMGSRSPR